MATATLNCPRCGGGLAGSGSGVRLCTCSDVGSPKTQKMCTACSADVTGKPRMKDSHGKYWCIPCGEEDRRKKGKGDNVGAGCPICKKMVPAVTLMKLNGRFVCPHCFKSQASKATAAESTSVDTGQTKKVGIAVSLLMAAGAAAYFLM